MIALQSEIRRSFGFWRRVSRGARVQNLSTRRFSAKFGPLHPQRLPLMARSPGPGGTPSPACGSDDLHADFISPPAICSLAHGDI